MLAENKHEHGSNSKLNIASTLRVSVLYQVEPSISHPIAAGGVLRLLTTGFTPPYHLHHRGATLLPTHGLPQQGLLCTVGVDLDPQECSTRKGDV